MDLEEKIIDLKSLEKFKADKDRTGVIYLARVPPGMAPQNIRQHFQTFGPLNRVYLTPSPHNSSRRPLFIDGWIEFLHKSHAKTAVVALNNRPIGGKKLGRFHDDLWCCKYLKGFKWSDLTEKLSYANAVREEKIKNERSQARREAQFYIKQSEKARILTKRAQKKSEKELCQVPEVNFKSMFESLKQNFRQRKPINKD